MIENAQQLVDVVNTELKDIAAGTSKLTRGAIYFEASKVPFCKALLTFQVSPTVENADNLKALADQDFGALFGNFVANRVNEFKTSTVGTPMPTVPVAPAAIPFEQGLYNHLSTILQYTLGRQMDVRQVERLTVDSNRLAGAINQQINERSKASAVDICKILASVLGAEIETLKGRLDKQGALEERLAVAEAQITKLTKPSYFKKQ